MNETRACENCGTQCFRVGNTTIWLENVSQRAEVKVGELKPKKGKETGEPRLGLREVYVVHKCRKPKPTEVRDAA